MTVRTRHSTCKAELRSLAKRGLAGIKLVISDAHEGLKAAIRRVFGATWQRCRVHWMRSALAHVPKGQQTMVAAALRQAFLQPDQEGARQAWRHLADQFRPRWPKLARLNKEVKRRADVVGIFPSEQSILRLIGAVLLEANDEWQLRHRYMQLEAVAELTLPPIEGEATPTASTQIAPRAA